MSNEMHQIDFESGDEGRTPASKNRTTTPLSKGRETHSQSVISRVSQKTKSTLGMKASIKNRSVSLIAKDMTAIKIDIPRDEQENIVVEEPEKGEKSKGIDDQRQ